MPATYPNPDNNREVRGRTEVERRGVYINKLTEISENHPSLVELMKQCLHNDPCERPSTDELLTRLQGMRVEVEGEYGGPVKLDMVRVRLAKEVKEKDRRLEEMQVNWLCFRPIAKHRGWNFIQARQEAELRRNVEETTRQLQVSDSICYNAMMKCLSFCRRGIDVLRSCRKKFRPRMNI